MASKPQPATEQAAGFDQLAEGPIFVTGHARSGTTWVLELLSSHPEVAGVYESYLFVRGFGVAGMFDQWGPDLLALATRERGAPNGLPQLVTREELACELRDLAERLLSRRIEPHHRFFVEKSPSPYMEIAAAAEVFPDARFVHVVRDGRDVAVSLRAAGGSWFRRQWAQFAGHGRLGRLRSLHAAARSWSRDVGRTRRLGRALGDRYTEVTYEELSSRPQDCMRRLFDFCRIPHDEERIQAAVDATDFARRFKGGEDQFRRGGRVGDWHSRFGLLDALAFELGSNGRLKVEGYERHRAWWATGRVRRRGRWPKTRA